MFIRLTDGATCNAAVEIWPLCDNRSEKHTSHSLVASNALVGQKHDHMMHRLLTKQRARSLDVTGVRSCM